MEGKLVLALPKPELQLHYFTLRTDGSLLASRLAKTVHDEFKIKPAKVILWTDSMIVLAWLRSESALLKPFVGVRVAEIQATWDPSTWKYVPTKMNPGKGPRWPSS